MACGDAPPPNRTVSGSFDDSTVEISGRAIKGVLKATRVNAYTVSAGKPNTELLGSALTGDDGSFSIHLPKWRLRKLTYLELSATGDAQRPSTMVCDAYKGCGVRNGQVVDFGESFLLTEGILLRNVIRLEAGVTRLPANFSPIKHMVVARAERMEGGLTWNNVRAAEQALTQLFLLNTPLGDLPPVDLLSSAEVAAASDEQLVLAVMEAAFLNIGQAPNYIPIEMVLDNISRSGGQFESFEEQDPTRLTVIGLLLSARESVAGVLNERPQVMARIENALVAELEAVGAEKHVNDADVADDSVEQMEISAQQTYSLNLGVSDGGSVTSLGQNLNCTIASCTAEFVENTSFTLTALAAEGFEFVSWDGDCTGSTLDCRVSMENHKTVSASFVAIEPVSGAITLSWSAPGLCEDGSPLPEENIHHYTIYYGKKSGVYPHRVRIDADSNGVLPTQVSIDGLSTGVTHYFAGVVVDKAANMSRFSKEIAKVVP